MMGKERKRLEVGLGGSSYCVFPSYQNNSKIGTDKRAFRLLLAFVAYFVLGAYYNYSTYGATGADLIPFVSFIPFQASSKFLTVYPLPPDIEISGAKCLTSFEISPRICAPHYVLRQGTVTSRSDSSDLFARDRFLYIYAFLAFSISLVSS